ncbi:MAG TPA: TrbI/VirB10 family protein [Vicinamibacterales bacterium]
MDPNPNPPAGDSQSPDRGAIRDQRVPPLGVLPRHVQMWLMLAVAVVVLAVIWFTGRPAPTAKPQSAVRPSTPSLVSPDRVRNYVQALTAEATRQQQDVAAPTGPARAGMPAGAGSGGGAGASATKTSDPIADDQRRREYQSLFADNVALSRRPAAQQPYGETRQDGRATGPTSSPYGPPDLAVLQQLLAQGQPAGVAHTAVPLPAAVAATAAVTSAAVPTQATPTPVAPADGSRGRTGEPEASATPVTLKETGPILAGGSVQRLLEGTVIDAVLLNRLDGTFAGPVEGLVTSPVYSHDRQSIVSPAGARVLGAAAPVQSWGDSRLAVSFHRLVMPDGRTYSLDRFKGLDGIGETGLKDSVNHHYLQVFGASLAIGALSGLAQYGTTTSLGTTSFADEYRQAAGSSLAASTGRVLDRFLNVLPTITIREGYRLKVYLTNDFDLPIYAPVSVSGGVR